MDLSNDFRWPSVTIVLLAREPGERELEAARLARAQTYPGSSALLLVDSSPDPTRPANRALEALCDRSMVVEAGSFHHSRTRNEAVAQVRTEVTVFLSSDAHPVGAGWLQALVRPIAQGQAEVSYGRQRPPTPDAEREATYGFLYPDEPHIKTKGAIAEQGFRALHFSDVSSAYLTETLREVPFPEDISIFQDAAIAKRLLDLGKRIAYVPDAQVLHAHPMSLSYMWNRYRGLGEVYERTGLLKDLQGDGHRSLVAEGLRVVRGLVPQGGLVQKGRSVSVSAVKAAAFAKGRRDARKRPPLTFEWTPEEGSRAIRR